MKQGNSFRIAILSIITAVALLTGACAQTPAPQGRISDFANVIDESNRRLIGHVISDLEERTTSEMAVVTIDSTKGEAIEDYANRLHNQWGIGKKGKDNGILLLIAVSDRKLKIEVGYGLEGSVPDGFAGDVIRNTITPHFKQGRFGDGIYAGALRLAQKIETDAGVAPPQQQSPTAPPTSGTSYAGPLARLFAGFAAVMVLGPILFIVAVIVIIVGAARRARICPRCSQRMSVDSYVLREPTWWQNGKRVRERNCPTCGFHDTHTEVIPRRRLYGSSSGWGGGFSSGGGGFSGGGGGGGFGGGSSGGGGASGSW